MGQQEAEAQKAARDLPVLLRFTEALLMLGDRMTRGPIRYDESNDFEFMCLCYTAKQLEHLKSVRLLVEAGQHRDAGLVARSMVEGFCRLKWVAERPAERAGLWRYYAWIRDWRTLQERRGKGQPVDPAREARITEEVQQHGHRYYTNEARKRRQEGRALPADPYRDDWADASVRTMCEGVSELPLYRVIYKRMSDWIHWNVAGVAEALRRDEHGVAYETHDVATAATALAVGFETLYKSLELLNNCLRLAFGDELRRTRDAYLNGLSGA